MSELDRELLAKAGLTPSSVAGLMQKSRQAISKGVSSDKDYFTPADLSELTEAVGRELPDKKLPLQNAIADMFDTLSERFGGGGPARNVAAAIHEAQRLWLIFPRFALSFAEQREAYRVVFDAIAKRLPATSLREPERPRLELTIFCDRNRVDLERRFEPPWFLQRRILIIECAFLDHMSPMIVVDPHREEANLCFGLVRKGFAPLAPGEAAALVSNFGAHLSDKINETFGDRARKPVDIQHDSIATLEKTGVRKL